ncbi:MAG: CRISPR-associated endonuclease Cas2 [Candidatus Dojkabacteria bacterium]
MLIVSYDISNDKSRTRFSKFLKQYGDAVQYSVYKVKNSKRVLNLVLTEVNERFKKDFEPTDSVYIFRTCEGCTSKIQKFGSAAYEEEEVVYLE